jgi:hypothetical protein
MLKDRPHDADRPLTALDLRPLCTAALLGTPWPRTSRLGLVHHALSSYNTPCPRTTRLGLVQHALASYITPWPRTSRLVLVHHALASYITPWPRTSRLGLSYITAALLGTPCPRTSTAALSSYINSSLVLVHQQQGLHSTVQHGTAHICPLPHLRPQARGKVNKSKTHP